MSEAIKEAMKGAQQEYRRLIQLLGHSRAHRLNFQKDEEDCEKELLVILKKIRNYESQMPKEELKGEKPNGESSNDNRGSDTAQPEQNSN